MSIVWVDEGLDELVPHCYGMWYAWFDGDWVDLLHGFNGLTKASDGATPDGMDYSP